MRLAPRQSGRGVFDVVVTSMLDINFLLIMFFIMTAQFQQETQAPLDLPKERGEQDPVPDEAGLVINITAAGDLIVSGSTIDLDTLQQRVDEEKQRYAGDADGGALKLMLRVDRGADSAQLNRVVTMLREHGVRAIRIATEVPL